MAKTQGERLAVLEEQQKQMQKWQEDQNGSLKTLADSYGELAQCVGEGRAYEKGRRDMIKVIVALSGSGAGLGLAGLFLQLFA